MDLPEQTGYEKVFDVDEDWRKKIVKLKDGTHRTVLIWGPRDKFDEVMTTILLGYVNNRLDFYNKMEDPKIKGVLS